MGKISIKPNRSYQKLAQTNATSSNIANFNDIAQDYNAFATNCSILGLDPTTMLNDLGGVDFSNNFIVMRARRGNNFPNEQISDLGNGVMNINSTGPSFGLLANWYKFFVMSKKGWNTVILLGVKYAINDSTSSGKIKTINKSCGHQNTNQLARIDGDDAPIGGNFNHIAFDYSSFANECSSLGFDPTAILDSLGGVDFQHNYVVIRARTTSTLGNDRIDDLGNGIISIGIRGRTSNVINNYYRFYVMCKDGWSTVTFFGVDYAISDSTSSGSGKIKIYKSCGFQNINKLSEVAGSSSIGEGLESVTLDYSTFVYNCELFGLDPNTISNSLGGIDFSKNYVIMRGAVNNTIPNETISNIGNNIIEISYGRRNKPTGIFYKFFVMCKEGWDTVRYDGIDYSLNN